MVSYYVICVFDVHVLCVFVCSVLVPPVPDKSPSQKAPFFIVIAVKSSNLTKSTNTATVYWPIIPALDDRW
jgi:hypothetical protein